MHDHAISRRTELKLKKETQQQEQDLADFKLERDAARAERLADFKLRRAQERQEVTRKQIEHEETIKDTRQTAELRRALLAHDQETQIRDIKHAQEMHHLRAEKECTETHYAALVGLGVDLSPYLAAVARGPPHRVIEVGGAALATHSRAHMHVHVEGNETAAAAVAPGVS